MACGAVLSPAQTVIFCTISRSPLGEVSPRTKSAGDGGGMSTATVLTEAPEIHALVSPFTRSAVDYAVTTYSHLSLPNKGYTWNWR